MEKESSSPGAGTEPKKAEPHHHYAAPEVSKGQGLTDCLGGRDSGFRLQTKKNKLLIGPPPTSDPIKQQTQKQVEEHEAHQYEGEGVGRRESLRPEKPAVAATAKTSEEEAKGAAE